MSQFGYIVKDVIKPGLLELAMNNVHVKQGTGIATALLAATTFAASQPASLANGYKALSMVATMNNITLPTLAISNPALLLMGVLVICWMVREVCHARAMRQACTASETLQHKLNKMTQSSQEEGKALGAVSEELKRAETLLATLSNQEEISAKALAEQQEKVALLQGTQVEMMKALEQLEAQKGTAPDAKLQELRGAIDQLNGHLRMAITHLKAEKAANQQLKKENAQLAKQNCFMFSRLSHTVAAL